MVIASDSAMGAGAVKSSIPVFGAEQIHQTRFISQYFDLYFCIVNAGSIIGTVLLTLIPNNSNQFFILYLIATITLFFSAVSFILGLRYYRYAKPSNTVVTECLPVLWYALRARFKADRNQYRSSVNDNSANSLVTNESSSLIIDERPRTFLDYAKIRYQGRFIDRNVDDVKTLGKAVLVFLLLVPYWLVYSQVSGSMITCLLLIYAICMC